MHYRPTWLCRNHGNILSACHGHRLWCIMHWQRCNLCPGICLLLTKSDSVISPAPICVISEGELTNHICLRHGLFCSTLYFYCLSRITPTDGIGSYGSWIQIFVCFVFCCLICGSRSLGALRLWGIVRIFFLRLLLS